VQDVQLGQHMPLITTALCLPDVIDNHIPHSLSSARLAQKAVGKRRCHYFGQVLVLGYGKDFLPAEAAQRSTIFERDHCAIGVEGDG